MTEKKQDRYCYVLDNDKPTVYDLNKKDILQMHQVEDLLNNLYKENEELKYINGIHRSALLDSEYDIKKLKDENEELKKENKELQKYLNWQNMELEELEDIDKNVIE